MFIESQSGGPELLARLEADSTLTANKSAKQGLSDMAILFTLLKAYNVVDKISFDLSLARGLDYYTGIIYEAIVEASAPPGFKNANTFAEPPIDSAAAAAATTVPATEPDTATTAKKEKKAKGKDKQKATEDDEEEVDESQVGVGSIAAGGRYDNLVGAFLAGAASGDPSSKDYKKAMAAGTPCIGVSIGMDRIFALVWPKYVEQGGRAKETMVYVMSAGDGLLEERIGLVRELREAGVKVRLPIVTIIWIFTDRISQSDFLAKAKPKLAAQFAAGEKDEVPFAIILGTDELKAGLVTVKEQKWEFKDGKKVKIESADKGTQVRRDELVKWLKERDTWKEWNMAT